MEKFVGVTGPGGDVLHLAKVKKSAYTILCESRPSVTGPAKEIPLQELLAATRKDPTKHAICPLCAVMAVIKLTDSLAQIENIADEVQDLNTLLKRCVK